MNEQESKTSDISPKRKKLYAVGIGVTALGVIMIVIGFAGFVIAGSHFNESLVVVFFLTIGGGMGVTVLGSILMGIAARGVAGSGLVLDPKQARQDLEPWARMGGGIVKDALDESGLAPKQQRPQLPFDEELRRLKSLKDDGLISEAEFEAARKKIMERL